MTPGNRVAKRVLAPQRVFNLDIESKNMMLCNASTPSFFGASPLKPSRIFSGVFILLFLLACTGCGGFEPLQRGGRLTPEEWLVGDFEGYTLIFDRNGNVRESGRIERVCRERDYLHFHCAESVRYLSKGPAVTDGVDYGIDYDDGGRFISVSIRSEAGEGLEGKMYASSGFFTGQRAIPLGKNRVTAVELRVNAISDESGFILERYSHSMLGVEIGSQQNILFNKKIKK